MSTPNKTKPTPRHRIVVTAAIINKSIERDSSHCVVAEALQAAVPEASFIAVDLQTIRYTNRKAGVRYVYLTPRAAQIALIDFDQGIKPKPFQFTLTGASTLAVHGPQGKAKLRVTKRSDARHRYTPTRDGGKAPPIGALASGATGGHVNKKMVKVGRRREFGLRALVK